MTTFEISNTVGAIVRDYPALSRQFEQVNIDYCCGGKRTLEEACRQRGIDPEAFLTQLEKDAAKEPASEMSFNDLSLTDLANHIEQTHHAYLHTELPRLEKMVIKVAAVHGGEEPRLLEIRNIFLELSAKLAAHLLKEEQVLFPMIRQLEASNVLPIFHCGSLYNPVSRMELEHDDAGLALEKLRQLTDSYTPPEWACNTYRSMLNALEAFEQDMHQHVHKENNVLFPGAIALEQKFIHS
ncbi:iron-sulfur cluster repair di-iron protein [Cyanobacteria bacterium FACHB-63]|nr:iron-sulfur cluster repair di-iron protein [Cyanobacteria bacterium FACHB-63]